MNRRSFLTAGFLGFVLAGATLYMGCKIGSSDSVSRHVGINVAGLYSSNRGHIVSRNTGAAITQLNLIQDGDRLQAIDNNGMIFKGTIGNASIDAASFTLKGLTTAGAEGIISGSITVSGEIANMGGTWAEPTLFGDVIATAFVAGQDKKNNPSAYTNKASCEAAGYFWDTGNVCRATSP